MIVKHFRNTGHISPAVHPRENRRAPMVTVMADGSDTTMTLSRPASGSLVDDLRSFAGSHGGAKAVIEYVGRRGARIVLVGEDGVWADQFAEGTDVARRACAEAGVGIENAWERELIEQMRPRDLVVKAVQVNTDLPWVVLYVKRWLQAPLRLPDGTLRQRDRGTAQGSAVSPVLANLFLHYAFDMWMGRAMPGTPFERYADDIICHCRSEREAQALWRMIEDRFIACGLMLHPQKTKIVYCKDTSRTGQHATVTFDFLGYTFQPRRAKWPSGLYRVSYLPAAGPSALKGIRSAVRDWSLQRRSDKGLLDLARMFNPYIRGWIGYYSHFYKSALYPTLRRIDAHLLQWAARKYKRFRRRPQRARAWLAQVVRRSPNLFAHWKLLYGQGRMLGAV